MRPVLPGANRPHPNYIVNPVQDTLNELLQYAQEEAMVEAHIAYLIQVTSDNNWGADVSKIKKAKKSTFLSGFDTLEAIRDDIGRILVEPNDEANRIAKKLCFLEEMQRFYRLAREKAKSQIGVYSQAHDDLIKTLGYYCSYCGMPVGVSVHVEHKLPKVGYPTSAVIWDNLLLACQSCNSSKGEKPSRLTGAANATPPYVFSRPPLLAHLPAVVETQIAEGSRASYVWPDDPNFTCVQAFNFRLMRVAYDAGGYRTSAVEIRPEEMDDWVRRGQVERLPPYMDKVVKGRFGPRITPPNPLPPGWQAPNEWEVELYVTAVNSQDVSVQAAARNVINELHLNRDQADLRDNYVSDLRVPLRTDAWFKAVKGIYRLQRACRRDNRTFGEGYQDLEDAMIESAVSSGFWLVWVRVIKTYIEQYELMHRLLNRFFDQSLFPGTNRPPWW